MDARYTIMMVLFGLSCLGARGQAPVFGAASATTVLPAGVSASDGTYDQYVLVRWQPVGRAEGYRVFRTLDPQRGSLQEISNGWQRSTWFCDYGALPGVTYFYAVAAKEGNEPITLSDFDRGFVRKSDMAIDDPTLLAVTDEPLMATGRRSFALISEFVVENLTLRPGTNVSTTLAMENIFEQATPPTELRYYLSADDRLNWDDQLLLAKTYGGFAGKSRFSVVNVLGIPLGLLPGEYYLFAVASPEGELLQSKVATQVIRIQP